MKKQLLTTLLILACAPAFALISTETKDVATRLGAADTVEVTFDRGSATLSDSQKRDLARAVNLQKQKGTISRVDILAWSDKEYPLPNAKHEKGDIDLANRRANEVKKYLSDTKTVSSTDVYNMAERPNRFEEALKMADARLKDSMEAGGAAPTTSAATGLFGQKGQAHRVLVMVHLK